MAVVTGDRLGVRMHGMITGDCGTRAYGPARSKHKSVRSALGIDHRRTAVATRAGCLEPCRMFVAGNAVRARCDRMALVKNIAGIPEIFGLGMTDLANA